LRVNYGFQVLKSSREKSFREFSFTNHAMSQKSLPNNTRKWLLAVN